MDKHSLEISDKYYNDVIDRDLDSIACQYLFERNRDCSVWEVEQSYRLNNLLRIFYIKMQIEGRSLLDDDLYMLVKGPSSFIVNREHQRFRDDMRKTRKNMSSYWRA